MSQTLFRNKALRLVNNIHLTFNIQSECFIPASETRKNRQMSIKVAQK